MFSSARPVVVALAATLLIAACGSDDTANPSADTSADTSVAVTSPPTTAEATPDTSDSTPDTSDSMTESTTVTTEAPAQDVDADIAAAEAALLTIADFPDGWTQAPGEDDAAAAITECVGVDSLTSPDTGSVSDTFSSPDGSLVVSESVRIGASEQEARIVVGGLTNPEVPTCLADVYTTLGAAALSSGALAENADIGEVTAGRLTVGAAGDATQAIRVVIPVTSAEGTTELTVDHVFVRSGRSLAALTFEGRAEATAIETIDELTTVATDRLPV